MRVRLVLETDVSDGLFRELDKACDGMEKILRLSSPVTVIEIEEI